MGRGPMNRRRKRNLFFLFIQLDLNMTCLLWFLFSPKLLPIQTLPLMNCIHYPYPKQQLIKFNNKVRPYIFSKLLNLILPTFPMCNICLNQNKKEILVYGDLQLPSIKSYCACATSFSTTLSFLTTTWFNFISSTFSLIYIYCQHSLIHIFSVFVI